ncbi:hypothetical protein CFIMG_004450RA [Ceratocystis fimbriata CBS 114723]|uniref:Uncharacterized protein n=1 Tax=Ceratocystis fimbriata CBS 114723 TaxID=1035309 RepID=A0A2C5X121_9PEZI|nr:hypothetical protein CFIMG_004450RA [Ceratocystis fimbriata CBS 114723]
MTENELPPSYMQAVTQVDPFALIGPELPFNLIPALIQVSKSLRRIFLPLLWRDPLTSIRRLGRDPYKDLEWLEYLAKNLPTFTTSLQETIAVLDLREFATKDVSLSFGDDISVTLASLVQWMPNLNSVLAGPETKFDLAPILAVVRQPRLLSFQGPAVEVSATMFSNLDASDLTYFEMSSPPGVNLNFPSLQSVRIFKLPRCKVNDEIASIVVSALSMHRKVWSIDLSYNEITDGAISQMVDHLFQDFTIRSNAYFFTEGRLINPSMKGHANFGPFEVIQESRWSCAFNHETRYFADSPSYTLETNGNSLVRNNGKEPPLEDNLEALNTLLSKPEGDTRPYPRALTHLNLSDNNVTSLGLEKLLRISRGFLEVLSCSGTQVYSSRKSVGVWKSNSSLYGVFGAAHLVRPVYSSNLRSLVIHHSLVTQIPSLVSADHSDHASLYLAEQLLLPRVQLMYPLGQYKPDMNPRLSSLTLTSVPRRSSGPLIKALVDFLDLLATQEKSIQESTKSESRRAPLMIRGLRHLRLEFEADPFSKLAENSISQYGDIQSLVDTTENFTFFPQDPSSSTSTSASASTSTSTSSSTAPSSQTSREAAKQAAREATRALRLGPSPNRPNSMKQPEPQSHDDRYVTFSSHWLNEEYTTKIWAGNAPSDPKAASKLSPSVRAYTQAVMNPALQKIPGPASPIQIRAGVPDGALIFHDAWEAALLPETQLLSLTEKQEKDSRAMTDVIEALRTYRKSKTGYKWTGTVSVVFPRDT